MKRALVLALLVLLTDGCANKGSSQPTSHTFGLSRRFWYGFDFQGTDWTFMNRHGDYSNSELQCYLPANMSISGGGIFTITAQKQTQTCGDSLHAPASWNYTSGMAQLTNYSFTYATISFRAMMAGGTGPWPAIWMLGANCQAQNILTADNGGTCNWPASGSDEIDITEILSSDHTHVNQQIHSGSNNSGCNPSTTDVSTNWHIYELDWTVGQIVWKIDGTVTCTQTTAGGQIPSQPMFLLANVAMGGAGGSVSDGTLPVTTQISSITVVQ